MVAEESYQFGPFRLLLAGRQLKRHETQIPLGPRAFDLLLLLVKNGDRLIGKDELMNRLWPDGFVEENNLSVQMTAIRKALGDDPRNPRFIQTVSGRGYRFLAAVQPIAAGAEGRQAEPPAAPSLSDRPSIAVLPFTTIGGGPDDEYFADGICEDIITALSRWRWFLVIARNSSFRYKGRAIDMVEIGRELGVRYLLEGSVRKAANRVRITAQLIDARNGAHLWADSYDRDLADIFAVQDEVTRHVVGAIEPALARNERELVLRKSPEQMQAWDHVLRGMWHFHHHTEAESELALACFRRAIALDPTFADAYAWAARPYLQFTNFRTGAAYRDAANAAIDMARQAVALDRENALGHFALALGLAFTGDAEAATEHALTAVDLNPNSATAYAALGMAHRAAGRYAAQLDALNQALRLSPNDTQAFAWFLGRGFALYMLGRYDEAAASARRASGRRWYPLCSVVLAASLGQLGDLEGARAATRDLVERAGRRTIGDAVDILPRADQRARFGEGLRKAGMPECGSP